ncbi:hypothetical protein BJP25_13780 [Actinokineospora bangkokensis]|uniref:Uncharacterized protein n=1 Tax=Actinokineospora bangkokensis TaxID=1193682 RepID=A0A1Q9LPW7_9PSEU|nr:hypothetical protein BJP25_13780 [Actinokineospora bangkokensis]
MVISGDDAESAEVTELLTQAGLNPRGTLVTIHHVEMKVAKRMAKTGTREVTLVINNRACEGFMGCRKLLPVILPAGCTLTVYGPGYHEVFTGGKKWPS